MKRMFTSAVAVLAIASSAWALSPVGTPEFDGEMKAIALMRTNYGGYKFDTNAVNMRPSRRVIQINARNSIGTSAVFQCAVKRVDLRSGGYRYEVANPVRQ